MMKKSVLSTLLLALVFSMAFVSCKHKDKTPEPTPTDNSNSVVTVNGTNYKLKMSAFESDGNFHLYGTPDGASYPELDLTFYSIAIPTSDVTSSCGITFRTENTVSSYGNGLNNYTIKVNNGTYSVSIPATTLKKGSDVISFSAEVSCKLQ